MVIFLTMVTMVLTTVKGNVKGFKLNYESETKLSFDERMKTIPGEIIHIEVEINQFQLQKDRNIKVNKTNKIIYLQLFCRNI